MRNLLAEYPAWFEPDEVEILVGAFDKAWETVQATGVVYAEATEHWDPDQADPDKVEMNKEVLDQRPSTDTAPPVRIIK